MTRNGKIYPKFWTRQTSFHGSEYRFHSFQNRLLHLTQKLFFLHRCMSMSDPRYVRGRCLKRFQITDLALWTTSNTVVLAPWLISHFKQAVGLTWKSDLDNDVYIRTSFNFSFTALHSSDVILLFYKSTERKYSSRFLVWEASAKVTTIVHLCYSTSSIVFKHQMHVFSQISRVESLLCLVLSSMFNH